MGVEEEMGDKMSANGYLVFLIDTLLINLTPLFQENIVIKN